MRIALFYPWIYLKGGPERTILEILRRSRHEWIIYTSHYDADGTFPEFRSHVVHETSRVSVRRTYGAVLAGSARIAATRLDLDEVDALLTCCDGIGTLITVRNARVPLINLCFTPLRAVYDPEYRRRHLSRLGFKRGPALMIEKVYAAIDRILWRRYRRVACISETVRDRVARGGLWRHEDIRVMYPGVDEGSIAASERYEPFFFLPGRIMWTKNIELGIEAFIAMRRSTGLDYRLVIGGMVDAKSRSYYERLRTMAAADAAIEFHVSPTDAEMRNYYDGCCAVLFTAFNEDLGLTPMEAMARGKPVIAVNRGGPTEVIEKDVSGYLVDPIVAHFSEAMTAMASDPARVRAMGMSALERVKRFTWKKFVGDLDDLLDEAIAEGMR